LQFFLPIDSAWQLTTINGTPDVLYWLHSIKQLRKSTWSFLESLRAMFISSTPLIQQMLKTKKLESTTSRQKCCELKGQAAFHMGSWGSSWGAHQSFCKISLSSMSFAAALALL
jgi:hypothetical protein